MFLQFLSSVKFQSQVVWVNFDRRSFFFFFKDLPHSRFFWFLLEFFKISSSLSNLIL